MTFLSECSQGSIVFPLQWEFNNLPLSIRDTSISKKTLISYWPNVSHLKVITLIHLWIRMRIRAVFRNVPFFCTKTWIYMVKISAFTTWWKSRLICCILLRGFKWCSFWKCFNPASRPDSLLHGDLTLGFATTASNAFCFSSNDTGELHGG